MRRLNEVRPNLAASKITCQEYRSAKRHLVIKNGNLTVDAVDADIQMVKDVFGNIEVSESQSDNDGTSVASGKA